MGTKENLLALLEAKRGSFVSGEEMAAQLDVSRSAIWKAVNALRRDGLLVEAAAGSGYRLASGSDFLSPEAIRVFLPPAVPLRFFQETSSTNIEGKRWAAEGAAHGSLVVAERQTAGRGRLGRGFASPPGGLYMSVVLRPDDTLPREAMFITAAAGVAACRAVANLCDIELQIKWVNDLFYNGKKCCGILTEAATSMENESLEYLVVGIGINFNTPLDAFPPPLDAVAASLFPEGDAPVTRAQLCAAVHAQLLEGFATLAGKTFLEEYRRRSFVLGKQVTVMAPVPYTAWAVAIDDDARLVVEKAGGGQVALAAGEISVQV